MAEFSLDDKNKQVYAEKEAALVAACKKKKRRAVLIGVASAIALCALCAALFVLFNEMMMKYIVIVFIVMLVGITFDFKMTVEACGKAERRKKEQIELLDAASPIRRFNL